MTRRSALLVGVPTEYNDYSSVLTVKVCRAVLLGNGIKSPAVLFILQSNMTAEQETALFMLPNLVPKLLQE